MLKKKSLGERIKKLFGIKNKDQDFFEDLEDLLIEGDIGAVTAMDAVTELQESIKSKKMKTEQGLYSLLGYRAIQNHAGENLNSGSHFAGLCASCDGSFPTVSHNTPCASYP